MDLLVECLSDPTVEKLKEIDFDAIEDDFIRIKLYLIHLHVTRHDSQYDIFTDELFPHPGISKHQYAMRSNVYRRQYLLNNLIGLFTEILEEDMVRIHYRIAFDKTWFHKETALHLEKVIRYHKTNYSPAYLPMSYSLYNNDSYFKGEFRKGTSYLEKSHSAMLRDLINCDFDEKEYFWGNLFLILSNISINYTRLENFDKANNFSQFLVQYYIHHHSLEKNTQKDLIGHILKYSLSLNFSGAEKSVLLNLMNFIIPLIEPEKTMMTSLHFFSTRLFYLRYLGKMGSFKEEFEIFFPNTKLDWLFTDTISDEEYIGYFKHLREFLRLLHAIIDEGDAQIGDDREEELTGEIKHMIRVGHNLDILVLLILYRKDKRAAVLSLIDLTRKIKMYDILYPMLQFENQIYGSDNSQELEELKDYNYVFDNKWALGLVGLEDFCWTVMTDRWSMRLFYRPYRKNGFMSDLELDVDISSLQLFAESQAEKICDVCDTIMEQGWIRCPYHESG